MSLPPATQDVSDHPAKGSVVVPMNKQAKVRDVSRKIKLYGAVEAFRNGRLPTNKQLDDALAYMQENSLVDGDKLSDDGRKVAEDARRLIETTRMILSEKNADELLQNFIWDTREIERETLVPGTSEMPVDRDTAMSEGQQALQRLRTLLHIVLTNSEARKLLSDFSVIGRDLLAKSAAKAAESLAPPEEALRNVDESAPENEFTTEGGRRVGPEETPVLQARLPGTDKEIRSSAKESEAFVHSGNEPPRPVGDVAREGVSRAQELRGEGMSLAKDTTGEAANAGQDVARQPNADRAAEEAQVKKTGFMGKIKSLGDRIPTQHKETAREKYGQGKRTAADQVDRGKRYMTEEYFTEERRNQFIYRGKKVIIECQKHDDYQQSIRWLLDFMENYVEHGRTIAGTHQTHAKGVFDDPKIDLATRQLRTLLERFANNTSIVDITNAINVLIDDSRKDPELRDWFKSVDEYVRRILLESGFVLEPLASTRARELRESGRRFYDDKYRGQFDDLFRAVSDWFGAMGQDPLNKRFGEDWARLAKDLLFTPDGALTFKSHLWSDLRRTVLPGLTHKLGYVPIPRIEYTDPSLDLVIENLALQGQNILPNIVSLEANNFVKFSPYNAIHDEGKHEVHLRLEQMQADMRDVAFYYRVKSGFPKVRDSGLADVLIGGKGIMATVTLCSLPSTDSATHTKNAHTKGKHQTPSSSSLFEVKSVRVKVDNLKFSIRDSKHDFLYKTIKPLATGLIKHQIQKAIKDALVNGLVYLDKQLVVIRDKMKADEGEERTKTEALTSLFHKKKDETTATTPRRRASEAESDPQQKKKHQFKIVSNKRDSLLAGEGHPAGWVNLTEERDRAAVSGSEWRSDAFDIVNKDHNHHGTEQERMAGTASNGANTIPGTGTSRVPPPVTVQQQSPTPAHPHANTRGIGERDALLSQREPATRTGYVEPGTGAEGLRERMAPGVVPAKA